MDFGLLWAVLGPFCSTRQPFPQRLHHKKEVTGTIHVGAEASCKAEARQFFYLGTEALRLVAISKVLPVSEERSSWVGEFYAGEGKSDII